MTSRRNKNADKNPVLLRKHTAHLYKFYLKVLNASHFVSVPKKQAIKTDNMVWELSLTADVFVTLTLDCLFRHTNRDKNFARSLFQITAET